MPICSWTGIGNKLAKATLGWESCLYQLILPRSRADLITLSFDGNALPKRLLNWLAKPTQCAVKTTPSQGKGGNSNADAEHSCC